MKAFHLLLAASFALAVTPFADAATGCAENPPREATMVHPLDDDKYLFIVGDASDPQFDVEKFGEWTESNARAGLQTEECRELGIRWYQADAHAALLP